MNSINTAEVSIVRNDFRKLTQILIDNVIPNEGLVELAIFCCKRNNLDALKLIVGFINENVDDYINLYECASRHDSLKIVDFLLRECHLETMIMANMTNEIQI